MTRSMKIINKYILVAAASLSVVACSQDDGLSNSYLKDSDAVHITAQVGSNEATGGFISRSNPLGSEVEQAKFNEGDAISVVADNQDAVIYSYDGTSWSPKEKGLHLVWNSNEMNFKAFYPANANGASFTDFTLPTAYTSLEDLALGDYMTFSGSRKRSSDNDGVNLEMERKMVRIVVGLRDVNVWGDTMDEGLELTEVIIHPNTNGYSDGEVVPADSKDVSVKAYKHTDGKFYALITPTMPVSDMYNYLLFMTVKVAKPDGTGEQEFEVRRIPPTGTEAGSSYEYFLKIGKDELVVDKITVSDWKTGEAIPGGEALDDVEFVKKTIADALAAGKKNIEIKNLAANAGEDVFNAIKEALSRASEGSIELTVSGIEALPSKAFLNCQPLKSIYLQDVKSIESVAFQNCIGLETIYAPIVSSISDFAFDNCPDLKSVTLGNISAAGISIFDGVPTNYVVDLTLSKDQKVMTGSDDEGWHSVESANYVRSDDHLRVRFLGKEFHSITCGNIKFEKY